MLIRGGVIEADDKQIYKTFEVLIFKSEGLGCSAFQTQREVDFIIPIILA